MRFVRLLNFSTGSKSISEFALFLEGGGHINGAFLQADLVDEVSLSVVPGIDGCHDIPGVFEVVQSEICELIEISPFNLSGID